MKHKLYIVFALLLLPMITSAAAQDTVRISNPYCLAGNAFTLRIPVRFPAGITVKYEWYRNGAAIAGTSKTLAAGATAITYTVPAGEAFGSAEVFHFKYSAYEDGCADCGEWTSSPKFMLSFRTEVECWVDTVGSIDGGVTYCAAVSGGTIEGDDVDLCGVSDVGSIDGGVTYCAAVSGGTIEGDDVDLCGVSDVGGIDGSVTYCAAVSGGTITGGVDIE